MAIKVFITEPIGGLTDQSGRIWYGGQCTWTLTRGQRGTAQIPFIILKDDSYRPTVGTPVFIHEIDEDAPSDTVVWCGTIDSTDRQWIGDDGVFHVTLQCVTFEQAFDSIRILPARAYFDELAGDIVTDLFNTLCAGVPVTLGDIDAGVLSSQVFRAGQRVSDAFDTLATQSGLIWGVRVSDQTLYLHDDTALPAPFTLHDYLYETGDLKQTRADYRNRQLIQIAFTAFSTSNEMFSGSSTSFTLRAPVDRVVSAMLTTSTQATAMGSFGTVSPLTPGNPAPGDTFTITPPHSPPVTEDPYTFVTALDNTLRNLILIGATPADTCQNTVDAINANPAKAGITFSLPTWENDACNADAPVSNTFVLRVRNPGSGGNDVALMTDSATFQWDSGTLSPLTPGHTHGGTDGSTAALNVGVKDANTLTVDVQYTPGSAEISIRNSIPSGMFLSVAYYRLGGDTIAVEDSAAVAERAALEHGSGRYQQIVTDTQNTDAINAYEKARALLATFKTIPEQFAFTIDKPGLTTAMSLTISVVFPDGSAEVLDGVWLVQEVQGTIVPGLEDDDRPPIPGLEEQPWGHFRYTVTVINVTQIGTAVDFFNNLATVSPAGSQTVNNVDIQVSTPSLGDPGAGGGGASADGVPTSGIPVAHPGQLWVQETVTMLSAKKGALHWVPIKSQLTGHQIILLIKVLAESGPTPRVTMKLTPFRYDLHGGYALTTIDPTLGPDYIISSNKITFKDAPGATDDLIAEYFAVGPPLIITPGLPDLWVAVHDDPGVAGEIVMTSSDGVTWDAQTAPLTDSGNCVGKGAGLFVIGTNQASSTEQLATSPDGVTWTARSTPADSNTVVKIAFGAGQFAVIIIVGSTRSVMTSPDGISWTNHTLPTPASHWDDLVYSPDLGLWAAVSSNGGTGDSVMTSPDAVTWTDQTVTDVANWFAIAVGAGLFVAMGGPIGSGVHLMTSPDGTTWTTQADPGGSTVSWTGLCFDGAQFVAVAPGLGGNHVATSPDGLTWTIQTAAADRKWQAVAADGLGNFVAVQNQSGNPTTAAMLSADGASWSLETTPSATFCHGVIWGGSD